MKILVIADKESKSLWDYYSPDKLEDIDLIISCGDLNPHYLQFLVTMAHCPVLYVHGNHDDKYERTPADGCICIENQIYEFNGIRILGFGGCLRYKAGRNQYEQSEMNWKARKLWFSLWKKKGFDILVTHAPALGVGDGDDRCHTGFEAYVKLLEKYKPKYFLHGHVHTSYGRQFKRLNAYDQTLIINGYETYVFEYETEYDKEFNRTLEKVRKNHTNTIKSNEDK